MASEDQRDLIAFLSNPDTWGRSRPPDRESTHISELFLIDDRAFKLKRAVAFSYLDFSTLNQRREACEAELALNRRTAPDLYLGLVPVRRVDGRFVLGDRSTDSILGDESAGEIVDWLVEMRRFDAGDRLDHLAARGEVDRHLCEDLAETIAAFHRDAAVKYDAGGADGLRYVLTTSRDWARQTPTGTLDLAAVDGLLDRLNGAVDRCADLLDERRAAGMVRHCHGDLHLGNICLWQGKPTPFDAIEFNDAIATIDVLYDLAFLVMDLDRRGHRRLANVVFNRYLDWTGDVQGLVAFPLFLALRALVRALASASGGDAGAAADYLAAADGYLVPVPPLMLAVGGLSGSGKSRMGRELAPEIGRCPGARVVRTDIVRKSIMGKGPLDPLGPEGYTAEITERTYAQFWAELRAALQCGQAAVADAVFARESERRKAGELAQAIGVSFVGLWLDAPVEVRKQRVTKRLRNPSDATPEVLDQQLSYDLGQVRWEQIDSSGPREATVARGRAAVLDAQSVDPPRQQ